MYLGVFRYMYFLLCCLDIFRCFRQFCSNLPADCLRAGLFNTIWTLLSGHKELPGFQRVLCHPFTIMPYRGGDRQDLIFARPPGARDFRLSLDTVWFFRVPLLFSFETETATEIKRHDCAFVSLFCVNTTKVDQVEKKISLLNTSKDTLI
jgi:hypothetical protein